MNLLNYRKIVMSEVKILFFISMFFYIVGTVFRVLSTWYEHEKDFKSVRRSRTLYTLSGLIFLGTVIYCWAYGMLLTYDLWK